MSRLNLPEDKADVPMGPLIDCVFLLLVFFLVSTMMKQDNKDIDILLPESASAQKVLPKDDCTVIGIDKEGQVYYDGIQSNRTYLHNQLRALALQNPKRDIRIDADRNAPFKVFAEVLNACQFYHLNNTSLRSYDDNYNARR